MHESTVSSFSPYQLLLRAYFSVRNSWPIWYGVLNRGARTQFAQHTPSLNTIQTTILQNLERDGIAFTSLEQLFPGQQALETLQHYTTTLEERGAANTKKEFLLPYWELSPHLDTTNPFLTYSLSPIVLDIVNSYDRMWRRLNYYSLAKTVPIGEKAPQFSQRWHRDNEEKRMVKFFIYLNDVDSEAGPFTYVKGSQFKGAKYGTLFPQKLPLGVYPPSGAVEKAVQAEDIIKATGTAGTVIFCDTAGLHRGGHAISKHRIMFTAFYPSSWWTESPRYVMTEEVQKSPLSEEARYALFLK